jgi:ankyrin repeat protein
MKLLGFIILCIVSICTVYYHPWPRPYTPPGYDWNDSLPTQAEINCALTAKEFEGSLLSRALSDRKITKAKAYLRAGATLRDKDGKVSIEIDYNLKAYDIEIFQLLINAGLDLKDNTVGPTILCYVGDTNQDPELVHFLIKQGVDPNKINRHNNTPLLAASRSKNIQIATALIEESAQVNATDRDGNTPLHLAASNNDLAMVKLLIKNGANSHLKNHKGFTPLDIVGDLGSKLKTKRKPI